MTIECQDCDGTGAHDFTGLGGEIETETCKGCDGTGNALCDYCDEIAAHEDVDLLCESCFDARKARKNLDDTEGRDT